MDVDVCGCVYECVLNVWCMEWARGGYRERKMEEGGGEGKRVRE